MVASTPSILSAGSFECEASMPFSPSNAVRGASSPSSASSNAVRPERAVAPVMYDSAMLPTDS